MRPKRPSTAVDSLLLTPAPLTSQPPVTDRLSSAERSTYRDGAATLRDTSRSPQTGSMGGPVYDPTGAASKSPQRRGTRWELRVRLQRCRVRERVGGAEEPTYRCVDTNVVRDRRGPRRIGQVKRELNVVSLRW